jgi:hypothetical protein
MVLVIIFVCILTVVFGEGFKKQTILKSVPPTRIFFVSDALALLDVTMVSVRKKMDSRSIVLSISLFACLPCLGSVCLWRLDVRLPTVRNCKRLRMKGNRFRNFDVWSFDKTKPLQDARAVGLPINVHKNVIERALGFGEYCR